LTLALGVQLMLRPGDALAFTFDGVPSVTTTEVPSDDSAIVALNVTVALT
jgi:hypothetical protein